MFDMAVYSFLWLALAVITGGIALLFAPYAWTAKLINGTQLLNRVGGVDGTITVEYSFSGQVGHIIKWAILCIITAGFAYPFYFWGAIRSVIDHAVVRTDF